MLNDAIVFTKANKIIVTFITITINFKQEIIYTITSNVHFVSVDLLNEYLCSLYGKSQEGKSIDAFINNKNALNSEERGDKGELSKSIFQKAFEIFIHATHYDVDYAFGCEKCPKELIGDENEDDFVDIKEVHICDGIDMGCQENSFKGFVDENMFKVPKVPGKSVLD